MDQKKKQNNFYTPDIRNEKALCQSFLSEFLDANIVSDDTHQQHKYMIQLQRVADNEIKRIDIYMEDLQEFFGKENERGFVQGIYRNTLHYIKLFSEVADTLMPQSRVQNEDEEELINQHREHNHRGQQNNENQQNIYNSHEKVHPLLKRKFQLFITIGPGAKQQVLPLRNLKSDKIGQLIQVKAIVIRISDVKPMIQVACFICDQCGYEIYQTINGKQFLPITDCTSPVCKTNKMKGKINLLHGQSKFLSYQQVLIQETNDQVPQGSIPRQFQIVCQGENVRLCTPGDIITVQGVYVPIQQETYKGSKNLIMDTCIEAFSITKDKKKYVELNLNEERIDQMLTQRDKGFHTFDDFYRTLAHKICPEIFGMEDVKKALLLLMVSAMSNSQTDGMKIRGDINIALVGDPGIAKSQLLKQVANLSPRGIYTTGKGSSGVGLTASVIKDPVTNEVSLEGGALVLADMGVCCIDEFDKMNEYDRTSIHEVMEQQTVSVAKAGITTSLNARTSILAAANPVYGRYNKKFSPHQNINLPAALLSRFDLIFILLDQSQEDKDLKLAMHIGQVHKLGKAKENGQENDFIDKSWFRDYVALAKSNETITLDQGVHSYIEEYYVKQRQDQKQLQNNGYTYITPRTLLGIIRLASAHARIRQAGLKAIIVEQEDIDEAIRLMEVAQESVQTTDESKRMEKEVSEDFTTKIYEVIKSMCLMHKADGYRVSLDSIEKRIFNKGYSGRQLEQALEFFVNINSIQVIEKNPLEKDSVSIVVLVDNQQQ